MGDSFTLLAFEILKLEALESFWIFLTVGWTPFSNQQELKISYGIRE